jgi:hypothetical protein
VAPPAAEARHEVAHRGGGGDPAAKQAEQERERHDRERDDARALEGLLSGEESTSAILSKR